jgi:hypothetical protein
VPAQRRRRLGRRIRRTAATLPPSPLLSSPPSPPISPPFPPEPSSCSLLPPLPSSSLLRPPFIPFFLLPIQLPFASPFRSPHYPREQPATDSSSSFLPSSSPATPPALHGTSPLVPPAGPRVSRSSRPSLRVLCDSEREATPAAPLATTYDTPPSLSLPSLSLGCLRQRGAPAAVAGVPAAMRGPGGPQCRGTAVPGAGCRVLSAGVDPALESAAGAQAAVRVIRRAGGVRVMASDRGGHGTIA